jgi:hypothetical protein
MLRFTPEVLDEDSWQNGCGFSSLLLCVDTVCHELTDMSADAM